jgi:large subunit ribosomal protein L9
VKVVLLKDVPGTGKAGTVVEVKEGHARNYLLPRGLAMEATEGALRQLEDRRRAAQQRLERERQAIAEQKRRLEALVLEIRARAGERGRLFGAVTSQQIAEALAARGFPVTRKQVELDDPIRVEGFYKVPVRLRPGVVVQVEVNVTGHR